MSAGTAPALIVLLRWRPFRLPLRHRFEAAHGALADRAGVLLELHDYEGRVGLGEASPMPSLGDGSVEDVLALLDEHAPALVRAPEEFLALAGRPGLAALACGIDTALLDLEGQRGGVPVARLLAQRPLRAVPVNAVIGSGSAEEAVTFAAEAVAAGYEVLKLKVATGALAADVARVAAMRRAHPSVRIRLDANGVWTEAEATEALSAFANLDVEVIEQPVRASALRALGRLRRRGLMRVAADEAVSLPGAVNGIIDGQAADLLVLKPMRLGGPRRSLEIARRAAEAGIPSFVTTTFDSSVGTAAALHLASALGAGRPADGLSTVDHLADDLVTRPLRPHRGTLQLPPRPGLGVELRAVSVERLATGPWQQAHRRR